MLRQWQEECADKAIEYYEKQHKHFLCQATPAAGKTVLAAEVAMRLLDAGRIDLVLCFSPSLTVAEGMKNTFSWKLDCSFNGGLGSIGASFTYQSLAYLPDTFWRMLNRKRLLVIFDEIHHCSGDSIETSNAWGEQVLLKIQSIADFTLALTGTPWRTDKAPIVMSEYSDPDGQIVCNYQYTLKQAVEDNVCRSPKIVLVDNSHLSLSNGADKKTFSSILELIKHSDASYQTVLKNEEAIHYLLALGCKKLTEIRKVNRNAGGLIVASSVEHAKKIQKVLIEQFKQTTEIVTYKQDNPLQRIDNFRHGTTEWIVSVGMISEGTDIPRLQVCCHLSAVKTELYFRQVLGRILRVSQEDNQEAWLYTFAEESLVRFAEQIEQDIPESCQFIKQISEVESQSPLALPHSKLVESNKLVSARLSKLSNIHWNEIKENALLQDHTDQNVDSINNLKLGQFKERIIAAFM